VYCYCSQYKITFFAPSPSAHNHQRKRSTEIKKLIIVSEALSNFEPSQRVAGFPKKLAADAKASPIKDPPRATNPYYPAAP